MATLLAPQLSASTLTGGDLARTRSRSPGTVSPCNSDPTGSAADPAAPRPGGREARRHDGRQKAERKIALLRRCGLFGGKTADVEIQRACTPDELIEAYSLVHEIFVEQGYCKPTEYRMRLRVFEATPQMATFVARARGRIVGVLSVVGDHPECGLPSDQAYRSELDGLRHRAGHRLCEWSNQVVAHDFRKTNVPTELMQCAAAHVIKSGYTHSVIAVSSVHAGFYELLGFHQIGPKRSYSQDIDDPVIPLCLPSSVYLSATSASTELTEFVRQFMALENPHVHHVDVWEAKARRMFSDPMNLRKIFAHQSSFLRSCGLGSQTALLHEWSAEVYRQVIGDTMTSSIATWLRSFLETMPLLVQGCANPPATR